MVTINLDDILSNEVITTGHYPNAQEAVTNILMDYLARNKSATIAD